MLLTMLIAVTCAYTSLLVACKKDKKPKIKKRIVGKSIEFTSPDSLMLSRRKESESEQYSASQPSDSKPP
ncbi:unnamed protein product [Cylicocyclus nassatus]|uniref:Uncharacterized protein n=1 Tax=Cylicocyclus nassatus TaxID=53992 RepID=A0AA36GPV8_CYLNA|nr:unnamed protein product [Cylicocyclus nassatus]